MPRRGARGQGLAPRQGYGQVGRSGCDQSFWSGVISMACVTSMARGAEIEALIRPSRMKRPYPLMNCPESVRGGLVTRSPRWRSPVKIAGDGLQIYEAGRRRLRNADARCYTSSPSWRPAARRRGGSSKTGRRYRWPQR